MINVNRELKIPESLQNNDMRIYIDNYLLHVKDPNINPKPDKKPQYRNSDLLEAFDRCFYSECYLTELKFYSSWEMDVEHFIPQNENRSLTYEWSNLYPADHKANMCKPRTTPAGGYLDPCDNNDDVENDIIYGLAILGEKPIFKSTSPTNQKALNTVQLLDRLHNGTDDISNRNTAGLRSAIEKKYKIVLNKIVEWLQLEDDSDEKFICEAELKDLLSRKSSFTMLIRSMPSVRKLPSSLLD